MKGKRKRIYKQKCPLCDLPYHKKKTKTRHHIYPKVWYGDGITVEVCSECHREFNLTHPMIYKWSKTTCLKNWETFCKTKRKNALNVYPHIKPP